MIAERLLVTSHVSGADSGEEGVQNARPFALGVAISSWMDTKISLMMNYKESLEIVRLDGYTKNMSLDDNFVPV